MALPSYSTGTVSVDADGTTVAGAGTIWTGGNAREGDDFIIAGVMARIVDVVSATQLTITAWTGPTAAGASYVIYQNASRRFDDVQVAEDVKDIVAATNKAGYFFFVGPTETEPDPSYGNELQIAFQESTGKTWEKQSGLWVSISSPYGLQPGANLSDVPSPAVARYNLGVPVAPSAIAGANHAFTVGDDNLFLIRSNAGAPMADLLPGAPGAILPNKTRLEIYNADSQPLVIGVSGGAGLDGSSTNIVYVGFHQSVVIVSDGSNYFTMRRPDYVKLGGNTVIYVDNDNGNDANSGLFPTKAVWTLNEAYRRALLLDTNECNLKIKMAATTSEYRILKATSKVKGVRDIYDLTIEGDVTNHGSRTVRDGSGGIAILGQAGAVFSITGMQLRSLNTHAVAAVDNGTVIGSLDMDYSVTVGAHMYASGQGQILIRSNYKITSSAENHLSVVIGGYIDGESNYTVTLSNAPGFSAFANSRYGGFIDHKGGIFSGACYGKRYNVDSTAIIHTQSGDPNYFPGDAAGVGTGFYD
ncbi:MAG: hypothetical protein J0I08_16150 [Rhizobiales bacterium]|nr:hypothetical protein [Hyphomicrobiales bacterium]